MSQSLLIDKIVAVSNTGPLISALQCGRIDLLQQYFSVIYITISGLAELEKHGWGEEISEFIDTEFVSIIEELTDQEKALAENVAKKIATDPTSHDPEWRNHLPEAEAIAITQHRTSLFAGQLLLDEKAARKIAQDLGLPLTGFPGILGRAGLDGLLTQNEIRQLLHACKQQGTHYID